MHRFYSCLLAAATVSVLTGCTPAAPDGAASTNPANSPTTNLDSEAKAREFGAASINKYIEANTFTDDKGQPASPPPVAADTWRQAQREGDRWTLKRGPPGNWYLHASFDVDGKNPEYEVQYFAE
jgi:hypothetical protein